MTVAVPWRRSLLVRLLAASIVIAVCSTAATAWLVMQGTTKAIRQEQGQNLSLDAHVYDVLVGYAATHASWDGVDAVVRDLADSTGQQVTLTTQDRHAIAGPAPTTAVFATVDPLQVDPALLATRSGQVDDRVVDPFQLPPAERAAQRGDADQVASCLRGQGYSASEVVAASGWTSVTSDAPNMVQVKCGAANAPKYTAAERADNDKLMGLVNTCLHPFMVKFTSPFTSDAYELAAGDPDPGADRVKSCVDTARRDRLRPYVAPAALLYLRRPDVSSTVHTGFTLSTGNLGRVAGVAALVLLLTIVVTVVAGVRLVRPLRALTMAASRPSGRIRVRSRDEIGALATVLHDMSERREHAEEQRKAMVSDVAHELRTPLANIRSWLEAAEDGLATPASDPQLTSALLAEALQLQHIIDDLQDLAAADAGTLRLDRRRVRVDRLVHRAVTAHRGSAADVHLEVEADEALEAELDPVRIVQALGNLVANAVRHTPAGGVVTVKAFADNGAVVLTVSDTGPGIAIDDLPHVFDRFWRADPSRSRDTGGSGLGLAIVRQIVEAHGGTVGATSDATFTIRLEGGGRRG